MSLFWNYRNTRMVLQLLIAERKTGNVLITRVFPNTHYFVFAKMTASSNPSLNPDPGNNLWVHACTHTYYPCGEIQLLLLFFPLFLSSGCVLTAVRRECAAGCIVYLSITGWHTLLLTPLEPPSGLGTNYLESLWSHLFAFSAQCSS